MPPWLPTTAHWLSSLSDSSLLYLVQLLCILRQFYFYPPPQRLYFYGCILYILCNCLFYMSIFLPLRLAGNLPMLSVIYAFYKHDCLSKDYCLILGLSAAIRSGLIVLLRKAIIVCHSVSYFMCIMLEFLPAAHILLLIGHVSLTAWPGLA